MTLQIVRLSVCYQEQEAIISLQCVDYLAISFVNRNSCDGGDLFLGGKIFSQLRRVVRHDSCSLVKCKYEASGLVRQSCASNNYNFPQFYNTIAKFLQCMPENEALCFRNYGTVQGDPHPMPIHRRFHQDRIRPLIPPANHQLTRPHFMPEYLHIIHTLFTPSKTGLQPPYTSPSPPKVAYGSTPQTSPI